MAKKNKYSYVGIAAILLIFGILVIPEIVDRIKGGAVVDSSRSNDRRDESTLKILKGIPDFKFVNQDGDTITNDFFKGKVHVTEFFFTTCPSICPIMNKNMRILDDEFYQNPAFAIASFTIDPEVDTVEVLKQYAINYEVKSNNWQFMTGDKAAIYALANKGFNLHAEENPGVNGGFEHSGYFALFDKEGNMRSRYDVQGNPIFFYDGLEQEGIQMLSEDIKILLAQ